MDDKTIINSLGGPTKVALLLGLDPKNGGVQRVQNWLTRGIPAAVKIKHPDLFLRPPSDATAAPSDSPAVTSS